MKKYDLIVIGAGGGTKLRPVADLGYKIAIIEKEDLGGTCLNRGCIPSKMLIHSADVAAEIRSATKYNFQKLPEPQINFAELVERVTQSVTTSSKKIEEKYQNYPNLDLYLGEAKFLDNKTITVNGEKITADKILIATGSRPKIPNIDGLCDVPYMTSREALRNTKQPQSMIVIGGGYIGVELGHFYGALGTDVTFLVRSEMISQEDREIAAEFTRVFSEKHQIKNNCSAKKVTYDGQLFTVSTINDQMQEEEFQAEALLVATGITPNTENLGLANTDIETDEHSFIKVDQFLQTAVPNVFAMGDVIGNYFFRHSVNFEGEYLLDTHFQSKELKPIDYSPMPHAIFSHPQVAGVGPTEEQLQTQGLKEDTDYIIGRNKYQDSAMGDALRSDHGLVKLIFQKNNLKLLAAHIVGPEASDMIHMPIAYLNLGATLHDMLKTIYIHPALPENIRNAARNAKTKLTV